MKTKEVTAFVKEIIETSKKQKRNSVALKRVSLEQETQLFRDLREEGYKVTLKTPHEFTIDWSEKNDRVNTVPKNKGKGRPKESTR